MRVISSSWRVVFFFALVFVNCWPGYGQYTETIHRELEAGEIPISKPGYYGKPGATYVLVNDIRSSRSGLFLGKDVTLDLNGYEIVYANGDYHHLPNYSFEEGKVGWDFSNALNSKILGRVEQVFIGDKVLRLDAGEEITSDYIELPDSGRSYFAICGVAKNTMRVSVYIEDSEGEIVKCINRYGNTELQGSPVENKHPQLGGGFVYAHMYGKPSGRYRVRIRAETEAIIDHVDLRPAMDVGVGVIERTYTNAHSDDLYDGWHHPAFYDYTSNFGNGVPLDSIPVTKTGAEGSITIKNGVIRSGVRGILSWGIQSTAESMDFTIDNVKVVSSGINTNAVEVPQATIKNCYFDIESPFIINRHGSHYYAVDLRGDQPSEVSYSEFYGGQGCLNFQGKDSDIHHNFFANRQMVTNHYSIMAGGNQSRIYENVFMPETGSGIEIYRRNGISIYNNEIYIEASPPTCEYGNEDYSVNGVRLADYNAKPGASNGCYNNSIFNNNFYITGKDYPEFPNYIPVATAIFYSASGGDNFVYNNKVIVDARDPKSKAITCGFYVGGGTIGGVFENNTVKTNVPAFWLATPYGDAEKVIIKGNTIIESQESIENYAPIKLGHGNNLATEIRFVSNLIQGGNRRLEFIRTRREHTYSVFWQLQATLVDQQNYYGNRHRLTISDINGIVANDTLISTNDTFHTILKEYSYYNRLRHEEHPYKLKVGEHEEDISLDKDTLITFTLDELSSIINVFENKYSASPNPVRSRLYISTQDIGKYQVKILDLHGKVYFENNIYSRSLQLDTSFLPTGVYILMVEDGKGVYTKRILKH
ncbi:T9SS type A sorting domain-containing protein [Membranihabitans maritimus]|uniref:T9SS type A sorting domain-containing protein n=1 Tax=Membranihabitans maritimus TaxID=2904244 RepID=UPI001F199E7F|nr:T9SS type A sorting domain-containing protein [Membranihabitans maritimus]